MNLWGWKHRGLQAIKQEDNSSEATLPLNLPQKQKSIWSWLLPVSCSVLLAMSVVTFTTRWKRGITQSPINLPPRQYIFQNHPELLPFDQETSDIWQPLGIDHWWSMEWRDTDGNRLTKGIDMLHKLHCLVSVREEFTMMANDEKRSTYFNGRNAESLTRRMHIRHCFDFIRSDIMCAADATVEPLGPGYIRTNGLGVEHECRDWDVLLKYAESNHFFPKQLEGKTSSWA